MSVSKGLTEQRNPMSRGLDEMSVEEILEVMNGEQHRPAEAVAKCLPQVKVAVEEIVPRLQRGGRIFYVGAGTSGRLGVLDASECPPTFHTPEEMVQGVIAGGEVALRKAVEFAEDDESAGEEELLHRGISKDDVVVGISCSGYAPYVGGAFKAAQSVQAYRILIACVTSPDLAPRACLSIQALVGPELIAGSTRLKGGTATKMILNMLSTASMIRLGKVYDNLMIDLRPSNEKLRQRARRLVEYLTKLDEDSVEYVLEEADWNVKTAVLIARGLSKRDGEELLQSCGGFLKKALKSLDRV